MNATEKARLIAEIYAAIPKVACKKICGPDYCGPILMSRLELARLVEAHPQLKPKLIPGIGKVLADDCETCPLLAPDGSCSAYDLRPAICRLFGAVQHPTMICRHGCQPERWLTPLESATILRKISQLGA
jgi:Fe-S-cluster containining protein